MNTFLAPNGEHIAALDGRVTTFGFSEEKINWWKASCLQRGIELLDTDAITDPIAISAALIINAAGLDSESSGMVFDYYTDVGDYTDETVFWIGNPKPTSHLRVKFKCYKSFAELSARTVQRYISALQEAGEWIA